MTNVDPQRGPQATEDPTRSAIDPAGRTTLPIADPSVLVASFGLACLFAVTQGMRITTLAGIYPIENSLILRHALATLMLVALILVLRKRQFPCFMAGIAAYSVIGCMLSLALAARYSVILVATPSPLLELAGKLLEEALCCSLIVLWANRILQGGLVRTSVTIAYSFLAQAAIQLVLSFFQQLPCTVALIMLPLISIGFYILYSQGRSSVEPDATKQATTDRRATGKTLVTMGVAAIIVFCLSFILGGTIFESLDVQDVMADEPLFQLCIIAGNAIGGLIFIFAAPHIRNRAYCTIFLMGCFTCCAVSLYLTTFLSEKAVGGYLISSSIGLQGTIMFIWYASFLVSDDPFAVFRHYVELYAAYTCAKTISSACMLLHRSSFEHIFSISISVSLLVLFGCCVFIVIRSHDAAHVPNNARKDPSPTASPASLDPIDKGEAREKIDEQTFFHDSVEALADEYRLTRQERRVLYFLAKGLNAGAISEKMVVSINTTKSHMRNIYAKLNVHSQQEIIALADRKNDRSEQESD